MEKATKPIETLLKVGLILSGVWAFLYCVLFFMQGSYPEAFTRFFFANYFDKECYVHFYPTLAIPALGFGIQLLFYFLFRSECRKESANTTLIGVLYCIAAYVVFPIISTVMNYAATTYIYAVSNTESVAAYAMNSRLIAYSGIFKTAAVILFVIAFALLLYRKHFVPKEQ